MGLKNKIAVITGASKGIGKAIALALAAEGAKLAISARSADLIGMTAREIKKNGNDVYAFVGDMSDPDDIRTFTRNTVDHFGGIDVLINNAGVGYFKTVAEMDLQTWDKMFNLNVRGMFIMTQSSLPYLRKAAGAAIVNIASLAGKNFFVGGGGYAASKHAVMGFSRSLMLEERKNDIRVITICPGSVHTPFFENHPDGDKIAEKNILHPEDVAQTVVQALKLPQHALISEIDIRPSNP